ncbi:hypothetical protein [Kitasatospora sp. NPDC097643]|uniref:class III lanthionine synthetase LanKC N-terminal domain-containing protein n=1 Tax=Kitasatospora sp. NPDC097643 TaxID=3157230 RepID=UPI00332300EA
MSAAPAAGEAVLAAVVRVIGEDPCPFRFAAGEQRLRELGSRPGGIGPAGASGAVQGAFITVHPADDAQFRRLAAALDRATAGLPGPTVPAGRPYRPGSRVHYRYGAVAAGAFGAGDRPAGGRTGEGPGALRRDRPGAGAARPARRPGGALLAGRYAITAVVRQGADGGVFHGQDSANGAEVVVKQARAPLGTARAGADARDLLRHEAALLTRLDGQGLAPQPIELIERNDSVLLVQERIAGRPLGGWVGARVRRGGHIGGHVGVDWADAGPLTHALVDLVERVHAHGLVLPDLSPGTVLVRPDGTLRLVGLGRAAQAGHPARTPGTPGYRAPEHGPGRLALAGARAATPAADHYALGGLLFLLATGHDPLLAEDLPRARPVPERLGRWLALAARTGTTAHRLAPAVLGLRAEQPERRWALRQVRAHLAGGADAGGAEPGGAEPGGPAVGGTYVGGTEPGGADEGGPEPGGPAAGSAGPAGVTPVVTPLLHGLPRQPGGMPTAHRGPTRRPEDAPGNAPPSRRRPGCPRLRRDPLPPPAVRRLQGTDLVGSARGVRAQASQGEGASPPRWGHLPAEGWEPITTDGHSASCAPGRIRRTDPNGVSAS